MDLTPDNTLTHRIIGCALEVHHHIGPGLLESIYETCLCHELDCAGLGYVRQLRLPVIYKGRDLGGELKIDIIVEQAVVVEVKAVNTVLPIHEAQLLTYLRLSATPLGLLINFNEVHLKNGTRRRRL